MIFQIEHYHDECGEGASRQILAAIRNLKESIMSGLDELKREIQEERAQSAQILSALTGLLDVVTPLQQQLGVAQAALVAAQEALAAANASSAELDAQLQAAAKELDDQQQALQPVVDAALAAVPTPNPGG